LWDAVAASDVASRIVRVGDAVATRTVAEAIREGRTAGLQLRNPRRPVGATTSRPSAYLGPPGIDDDGSAGAEVAP
jgi:hypothetical protein